MSRVKEVIRRRGENLSPLEVEEVLESHPAVVECAVVGVPSELSEEEVKAFVVAAAGAAAGLRRAARVRGRPARAVQGAAILAAARRAAADADSAGRQAPAARTGASRRVSEFDGADTRENVTEYPTSIGTSDADYDHPARA